VSIRNRVGKGYFLLSLAFLDSRSVEIVTAAIRSITIEITGNSGVCCVFDVEVGDEFEEGVESVGDGLPEAELGLDEELAVGPTVMSALMFVCVIV
jgi:hypothetical protein